MRIILFALMALACAMPPAEAARRDERRTQAARVTQQAQPAARPAARPAATAPRAATSRSTPRTTRSTPRTTTSRAATSRRTPTTRQAARSSTVQRGDVRSQRSGVLVRGAAAATVSRAPAARGIRGWQSGLPTVSYNQRECPEGTFATLARGHDDVVRCMPI